jgi:hypothetical protein
MVGRSCGHGLADGRRCRATPMRDGPFCFWHTPEREEDAAEARRLGGLRRRRERTVSGAYDFAGLGSIESIRRILEIAVLDALGLENSIARARLLIAGGQGRGEANCQRPASRQMQGDGRPARCRNCGDPRSAPGAAGEVP